MKGTVHVGFGFHVNCYHSYRGDTCDALGFGGDIRTIRYIIDTLDRCNAEGIPVRGTWDFENAYSLEQILPQYAPDIIENVRRRQKEHGDANILMGYNNGAMSAMTEEEFMTSVQWAVSNEKGSGLIDVFGACEKIIRPQEVMFTPSEAALYQKAGIDAVCLYYSCVPFDAFGGILPRLSPAEAFNPMSYCYKNGKITIMPACSHSDILDAGSLRFLVSDLHRMQLEGEIDRDVFIFVNIDADSFLWEPMPVPKKLRRIPNCNGLEGLIREVADLGFVRFDTPGNYLKEHPPVREIFFGEDVADGNFSGYASWAEKPFNRLIWTRLERARMYARLYSKDSASPSFRERVLLLSTTHFGLASPVLNITREEKALELSSLMMEKEEKALKEKWESKNHTVKKNEIWLKNSNPSSLAGIQLRVEKNCCKRVENIKIKGKHLLRYAAVPTEYWDDGSIKGIYLLCRFENARKKYKIRCKIRKDAEKEPAVSTACVDLTLSDGNGLTMRINEKTGFPEFYSGTGKLLVTWKSWITYKGRTYDFGHPAYQKADVSGMGNGIVLSGQIHLPGEAEPGHYSFLLLTMEEEQGIYLLSEVCYPYTEEKDIVASQAFHLGRYTDLAWEETAPMELSVRLGNDAVLEKRNFMEDISSFPLADFWNAFPQNCNLDSFNHQLTGGMLAWKEKGKENGEEEGIVLAHARGVLGGMAHCPMRLRTTEDTDKNRLVSMNPFGTYDGSQRYYPTRGNGSVMELYCATMPQARSLAPAYNGACERSIQRLSEYAELKTKEGLGDVCAFADGCVVYAANGVIRRYREDNVILHTPRKVKTDAKKIKAFRSFGNSKKVLIHGAIGFLKNLWQKQRECRRLTDKIQKLEQ